MLTLGFTPACADAGASGEQSPANGVRLPPNTGTAPDHIVACIDRVRRDHPVQGAVRLYEPVETASGTTIDGRVERVGRFRCVFDTERRLIDLRVLSSDGK